MYGARPVVAIFAREVTDDLASLVKQIEATVAKNQEQKMVAFLILLTEDPDKVSPKLEELAKASGIKHTPLTIFDGEAGPPNYKIAKEADVTVLLWRGRKIEANHALGKGGLNKKAIDKIVADTKLILK